MWSQTDFVERIFGLACQEAPAGSLDTCSKLDPKNKRVLDALRASEAGRRQAGGRSQARFGCVLDALWMWFGFDIQALDTFWICFVFALDWLWIVLDLYWICYSGFGLALDCIGFVLALTSWLWICIGFAVQTLDTLWICIGLYWI